MRPAWRSTMPRIKGDDALCSTMDMVVAAAGGERDEAVDAAILAASLDPHDLGMLLNEKLTTELRPTLFLAQLSNLLAGNISIVHKVTGSSRTFMGEEGSGVSAVETAAARIRSGQSTHMLVGARLQCRTSRHAARATSSAAICTAALAAAVGARRLGRRRRGHRLGRGLPRAGIARACREARRQRSMPSSATVASGQRPARRRLCRQPSPG